MKCIHLESLLCDYVDGTLSSAEKATVELHLEGCPACRELVADSQAVIGFMEKAAAIEPPAALVNQILFEARTGKSAPVKKSGAARNWISKLLEPFLQPKFAMGMAMTLLSFSMLARFAGLPVRPLKATDLEPARVWSVLEDKAYRSWDRGKKYYESLRLVFEIQQTLRDWNETDDGQSGPKQTDGNKPAAQKPAGLVPAGVVMEGPIENHPQGIDTGRQTEGRVRP